jgi:hypothetical protein
MQPSLVSEGSGCPENVSIRTVGVLGCGLVGSGIAQT